MNGDENESENESSYDDSDTDFDNYKPLGTRKMSHVLN